MISFILRRLATYLSFLFINKPSDLSKNDKILNKIYKRMSKTKIKSLNLKDTHIKFNSEIYRLLKTKKIKNFLRESFIQKMFFVHNRLFILNELKYLYRDIKWNFYKKLLVEDNVGNPVRYFLYPKSSGNKINHVFHLCTLINQFNIDIKNKKCF